jgi:methionyl-tRNA synthetase
LVSRVTTVVHSKCGGVGPACDTASALAEPSAAVLESASAAWARWAPHEALEETWHLIGAANARLEEAEPWKMDPGPEVDAVLGDALEVLRIVAVLASPAMPATAAEVWRRIGLDGDPGAAHLPADAAWGGYRGGTPVVKGDPLFPRRKASS